MRRTVVYLACPMRKGSWTKNVRSAAKIGRDLIRKGYSVINPMGSWLLDVVEPVPFEEWINNDFGLIEVCDCLLRIPGESEGADMEMDYAVRHDVNVFDDLSCLYLDMPIEVE